MAEVKGEPTSATPSHIPRKSQTRPTNPSQPREAKPPWRLNGPQRDGMPRRGSFTAPSHIWLQTARGLTPRSLSPPNRLTSAARGKASVASERPPEGWHAASRQLHYPKQHPASLAQATPSFISPSHTQLHYPKATSSFISPSRTSLTASTPTHRWQASQSTSLTSFVFAESRTVWVISRWRRPPVV